ncbi:hypothetical protein M9Y10_040021 [Tritrichomonas musculus]|uniref:Uncharacterized protein n=1 Tax=Tritrichomonas musculus TaxID=1915356 RepID=A0ABR2GQA6_9EUKA
MLALNSYTEMVINYPEELAQIHFQTLSTSTSEQERTLILILIGRYFAFLKSNDILLSGEASLKIQNSLLSIFQSQNLSPNDFNILSNDIVIAINYFKEKWPQLLEALNELLYSSNKIVSSSISSCLSEIIPKKIYDISNYFEIYFIYVQSALSSILESDSPYISSILLLFFALADYGKYSPPDIFIPILSELPNILRRMPNKTVLFNIVCSNARFELSIFDNLFDKYFELFIEMLTNPGFPEVKSIITFGLNRLVSKSPISYMKYANYIFDIYTQIMSQEDTSYEISDLAELYGSNKDFAFHAFEYLKNNAPNPKAYIAFGSSFKSIKIFFINSNMSNEILSLFAPGFTSQDHITRYYSINSFRYVIKNVDDNEEWSLCSQNCMNILMNVITSENNKDPLLKEIQLLLELLKKFPLKFSEVIENIVLILDQLSDNCTPIEYQNELFQCYKCVASSFKERILNCSQNVGKKMFTYISNPFEYEDMFFNCIEILPDFNCSFPQDFFNGLLQLAFQFLFGEMYDENGNERDKYPLSNCSRLRIITFFLSCLQKGIINNSFIFNEVIIKIAFSLASKKFDIEKVSNESELPYYVNCMVFFFSGGFHVIDLDQFHMVEKSLSALSLIFKSNEQIIPQYCEKIYKISMEIFRSTYYSFQPVRSEVRNDAYELMKCFFIVNQNIDDLTDLLKFYVLFSMNNDDPKYKTNDYVPFTKSLIELAQIIGNKFKSESHRFSKLVQMFFDLLLYMLRFLIIVSEICLLETTIHKNDIYYLNHEEAKINTALVCRELFRYFPGIGSSYFNDIVSQISKEENHVIRSIIYSDFIHYCPQQDPGIFNFVFNYFNEGLKKPNKEIQFDSIYGLSIILTPFYFNAESMNSFVLNFLNSNKDAQNEMKSIVVFFVLQAIQNYQSLFDCLSIFLELFDENVALLPNYCIEYLIQSLDFFSMNFASAIPEEKADLVQEVILQVMNDMEE